MQVPGRRFSIATSAWLTLALGCGLSGLLGWTVQAEIRRDAQASFSSTADRLTLTVGEHLHTLGLVLRSAAGLISSSEEVTREDWRRYVRQLELDLNLPGVRGIGYVPLIPPADLAAHEARVQAEGFPGYRVTPSGVRDSYTAILYLEPFDTQNQRAFGYDMYSEPTRRQAMETARDSGQPALSGKVQLLQEGDTDIQAGTLMYFPVYVDALALPELAQRRSQLQGWTYSPLRMGDFMRSVLLEWPAELRGNLQLELYSGTVADSANLLFSSAAQSQPGAARLASTGHQERLIDFHGQSWLLVYNFDPASVGLSLWPAWFSFGGGLIVTLLMFSLQLSLQHTRQRAGRIAGELTADIRSRDAQLRESEFRWKFALEGAGDGVWDWNMSSDAVYFSPRLKAMLGYDDAEFPNHLNEWKRRIHPDDLHGVEANVQTYLEGGTPDYHNEYRMRCKDGSYRWIMGRGIVVERDRSGKPLRMIGTHSDIHARKEAERQQQETLSRLQAMLYALDQVDTYVYMKDSRFRYTYANRHCLELFGTDQEGVQGKTDFDLFSQDSAEHLRAIDQRVLAGANTREEIVLTNSKGKRDYIEVKTPLRQPGQEDRIIGLCGIATDITERKHLEASLQQRQHELEQALRIGGMGSWSLDLGTGKVQWTNQLFRMFGMSPGEEPPDFNTQARIFTPASWQLLSAAVQKTRDEGLPYELELETLSRSGIRGWMLVRGEAVRDAEGRICALQGMAQDITQRKRAAERIEQLTKLYAVLNAFSRLLLTATTADEIYQQACDILIRHGEMDMAWIGLVERGSNRVLPLHAAGRGTDYLDGIEISIDPNDAVGRGATGTAIRENRPVWIDNFRYNPLTGPWQQRAAQYGWAQAAGLPICRGGKPIGAITFYSSRRSSYDREARALLEEMSRVISHALDRLDAEALAYDGTRVLQKVFLQTVGLATHLVELRDPYTAGHVRRVSALAEAIGVELGFNATRLQGLRVAGFLYDIGKILIPAEILSKPGPLTAVEHQLIRQHPQAGFELLQNVEFPWPVADVALQHHERLDGSGYPKGLRGDSILLEARIIGLADVVLAMCSHRPWRAALPPEQALADIEQGRGSRYDAEVVDACLRVLREGRFVL